VSAASVFGFILALLAVGRILRARAVVPETAPETLNVVALYVCMPAAILLNAPQLTFARELLGVVAVPWILLAASVAVVLPLSKVLRADRATRACLLTEVPMGNTAFMGYALIPTLAGKGALRYAVVYDQFGSFLILGTYGLFVVAMASGGTRPTPLSIAKRIVMFPPFIALLFGMTLMPAELPPAVSKPLEILSGALLPIVGLAVGMQMRLKLPRAYLAPLGFGVVAKLVLLPLLALALCSLFGLRGEMRAAVVLESAMPTMMTTGALLSIAGLAPELAAAMVGYSTIVSMATLPLWQRLL
jgi:predicted permease